MLYRFLFFSLIIITAQGAHRPSTTEEEQKWILRQFQSGLQYNDYQKIQMILECVNEEYKAKLLNHLIECNTSSFLHYTVRNNLYEISELLLKHGADITKRDFYGRTPLHLATQYLYNLDMIKLLLAYGADINAQEYYHQDTPLHVIIKRILETEPQNYGYLLPLITFLLQSFPDVKLCNNEGKSIFRTASDIPFNFICRQKYTHEKFACSCKFSEVMQNLYTKKFGTERPIRPKRIYQRQEYRYQKNRKLYPKKQNMGRYATHKPHLK